jgi:hypothetical protein
MKKNFITKEYSIEPIAGTLNMKEGRTFFTSKILELEDIISIDENDIIWNESIDKTQGLGVDSENKILDTFTLKSQSHTLRIYPNQTDQDKLEFTRWEFTFDLNTSIRQYLFAQLKKNKTFSGISNDKTRFNDIDRSIMDYIDYNIIPRIKFDTIELFVQYYKIGSKQENGEIALQYQNKFREDLIVPIPLAGETNAQYQNRVIAYKKQIKSTNFQMTTNSSQTTATVLYKATESSLNSKFDYYFNIIYKKA